MNTTRKTKRISHTLRSKRRWGARTQILSVSKGSIGPGRKQPTVRIKNVLAPIDFSDLSMTGLRYAVSLGARFGASVRLVHVVKPSPQFTGTEASLMVPDDSEVLNFAQRELATIARKESKRGLSLKSFVRYGQPFYEIAAMARERDVDLIVIATHGHTGVSRVLLGSTAERVVRHAPCSVLSVRAHTAAAKNRKFHIRKILVPIDFSKLSKQALPWAAFLGAAFHSEVLLLNVTEKFPVDYFLGRELTNHVITPLMKQAEAELERIAQNLRKSAGVEISVTTRDGTPYKEICDVARSEAVDLIALTTHGYTGLKHVWLGSTAERVVRHAHCPVLVVRGPMKPQASNPNGR